MLGRSGRDVRRGKKACGGCSDWRLLGIWHRRGTCPQTCHISGLVKGAAGTLVKPVAAIGTAFGEALEEKS